MSSKIDIVINPLNEHLTPHHTEKFLKKFQCVGTVYVDLLKTFFASA